jgi:hypothetical protein
LVKNGGKVVEVEQSTNPTGGKDEEALEEPEIPDVERQ